MTTRLTSASRLEDGEVHVWWTGETQRFIDLNVRLRADEQERAGRFRAGDDRDRFAARRRLLRALLARYHGGQPDDIELLATPFGKLHLATVPATITFSMTSSGPTTVFAFTRHQPIGVDVESYDRRLDERGLARMVCTPSERAALAALDEGRRSRAFFTFWTHKEAVSKADGRGLSLAPTEIDVAWTLDDRAGTTVVADGSSPGAVWHSCTLELADELSAAVATALRPQHVLCTELRPDELF